MSQFLLELKPAYVCWISTSNRRQTCVSLAAGRGHVHTIWPHASVASGRILIIERIAYS